MKKIIKSFVGIVIMTPMLIGFTAKTEAASGKIQASTLNVRMKPSTNSKIIGKVYRDNIIDYSNYNKSWVKIKYKNKTAYVSKKYVQTLSISNVKYNGKITANSLIVKEGIGGNTKNVGTLSKGKVVKVTKRVNSWLFITSGNLKGWVESKYVTKVATTNSQKTVATSYVNLDIRYPSKVKADEINNYISNYEKYSGKSSVFKGKGQLFIDVGNNAGINPLILASMAIHESAYGTNELSKRKYNLFSVGANDSNPFYYAHIFQNVEHSVKYQAKFLKEDYLNKSSWKYKGSYLGGAKGGLNYYYATDKEWGKKIAAHANRIHPFNGKEHSNIKVMSGVMPTVAKPIVPKK